MVKCSLCEKEINGYSFELHHLKIDDSHEADICQDCIDKFTRWQGNIIAKLFPTKALKKRFDR